MTLCCGENGQPVTPKKTLGDFESPMVKEAMVISRPASRSGFYERLASCVRACAETETVLCFKDKVGRVGSPSTPLQRQKPFPVLVEQSTDYCLCLHCSRGGRNDFIHSTFFLGLYHTNKHISDIRKLLPITLIFPCTNQLAKKNQVSSQFTQTQISLLPTSLWVRK